MRCAGLLGPGFLGLWEWSDTLEDAHHSPGLAAMIHIQDVPFFGTRKWETTFSTLHQLIDRRMLGNVGGVVAAEDDRFLIDVDAVLAKHPLRPQDTDALKLAHHEIGIFRIASHCSSMSKIKLPQVRH